MGPPCILPLCISFSCSPHTNLLSFSQIFEETKAELRQHLEKNGYESYRWLLGDEVSLLGFSRKRLPTIKFRVSRILGLLDFEFPGF